MKITSLFLSLTTLVIALITVQTAGAQQYKLRQSTTMSGMKSESTIYVKGMRKRTEGGGFMGMGANIVTIEQCDLQRTIRINDKKKLYYIEPFSKDTEEKPAEDQKSKPVAAAAKQPKTINSPQTGGIIRMYYNITDTGERKKMYGFTARHVWTTQKIKPSPDACSMKDSMIIKTDGWYIDLAQFNCPIEHRGKTMSYGGLQQTGCKDRYESKRTGKGKLGFALIETKTMIMGNGSSQSSTFETSLETLEFSTAKLDSMLFEIPLGYTQTLNEEDLQDKQGIGELMGLGSKDKSSNSGQRTFVSEQKQPGKTRIGVLVPMVPDQLQGAVLQEHLAKTLTVGNVDAVAINSTADAKKFNCDLLLNTEIMQVKQGSKVGSLLKAIKNTDPGAATSFNIEAKLVLVNISDGSTRAQKKVNGKFDGKAEEAVKKAMDKGCGEMVNELE